MKVSALDYTDTVPVCPKCHRPVARLQLDSVVKTCSCGYRYKNRDLKTRVTTYKLPEVDSVRII